MGLLDGEIAAIVADALGGDIFLPAVLIRDVIPSGGESFDPPAPIPTTYTCKAIESEYSAGLRAQGLVGAQDVEVLILAKTLAVEPAPGDRLSVNGGAARTIVPADAAGKKAVVGDPARATWACRCRT